MIEDSSGKEAGAFILPKNFRMLYQVARVAIFLNHLAPITKNTK